jgi:hypothetical protein
MLSGYGTLHGRQDHKKVEKTVEMSSIAVDCGRRPIGLFRRQRHDCKSAMNKDAEEYGHMDEEIEQAESRIGEELRAEEDGRNVDEFSGG